MPATGTVDVSRWKGVRVCRPSAAAPNDVWDGEPEGVYVPAGATVTEIVCHCATLPRPSCRGRESTIKVLEAFRRAGQTELDKVQYGSDDTKTHRKIKHILGQKQHDKVGRLLVSELFTVGQGGWSGFPAHKHDTDNLPHETRHDETYNFRFRPKHGSGVQMLAARRRQAGRRLPTRWMARR